MLKRGTQVYVYEDPFTRLRLEGTAKVVRRIHELADGAARYEVQFDSDAPGSTHERTLVEAVAASLCCCHEQPGDNPDCKVHVLQVER